MSVGRSVLRRLRREARYARIVATILLVVLPLEWLFQFGGLRDVAELHFLPIGLIFLTLTGYAVLRARDNVPYSDPGYRSWLATTPWTLDKPLPFGPIGLDWPDAVVVAGFIGAYATVPGHQSARLLAVFLFFHALAFVPTIWKAANHVPAYLALFGLGLMVRLWPQPWACATTGVVVYMIVYDGMRQTLAKFPEPGDEKPGVALGAFNPETASCGWPYDRLLREPGGATESVRGHVMGPAEFATVDLETLATHRGWRVVDSLASSLLLGWWVFCVGPIAFQDPRNSDYLAAAGPIFAVICCLVRLANYLGGYRPPISLWGRIPTFRWIIPGYDVVFVGPLLTLAIPAAIFIVGLRRGVPAEIQGATSIAAALFVALAAPPSLRRWRLVGTHRMVPGMPTDEGRDD